MWLDQVNEARFIRSRSVTLDSFDVILRLTQCRHQSPQLALRDLLQLSNTCGLHPWTHLPCYGIAWRGGSLPKLKNIFFKKNETINQEPSTTKKMTKEGNYIICATYAPVVVS